MTPAPPAASAWPLRAHETLVAGAWLALLGVTWRLWTPQTVFPQVPLLAFAREAPAASEWLAILGVVLSLAAQLVAAAPTFRRILWGIALALSAWLILVDQNRAQAWLLQLGLAASVLAALPDERWTWLRWLALAVYFWSAVSKLSVPFLTGIGPTLVEGLGATGGLSLREWSPFARGAVAALLPLGELATALALAWPSTRKVGLVLATLLHLGLCIALGPWGLNHSLGVLLWNVAFLGQVWVLFASDIDHPPQLSAPPASQPPVTSFFTQAARGVVMFVLVWPAGEWLGWCDAWPAWALYSGRTARTELLIDSAARLPVDVLPYVAESSEPGRVRLRLDAWCLGELGVPLYPAARVQLGVALAVAERWDSSAAAILSSPANPLTGARTSERLSGVDALRARAGQFWWNATPRR